MDEKAMKLCTKHNLEIVLVDLEAKIVQGTRFLCLKCIIEKMNLTKIKQIDETNHLIQEMNKSEINRKIEDNNKRLKIFNTLESQLRELKQNLDSVFDEIFNNIRSKQSQIVSDKTNIQQQSITLTFEEDIERLSQFQECYISEQVIHFTESDQKFIEQIQMQLKQILNSDQYNDSFIFIDSYIVKDDQNSEENYEITKSLNYKTPALKLLCEEHKKEIIMFNLDMKTNSQPKKMACIKCLQQYPAQYTPLEDASILWSQYQMRNETNVNEIQKSRNQISSKILQVIQEFKLQQDQVCDELIQTLRNQQQPIGKEQQNQKQINVKSIYQLTQNQILAVIDQLSQNDKKESSQDHKMKLEKIDKIFYSDLYSRLEHQIQQSQIHLQKFNSIVNNNNNQLINQVENLFQLNQQKDKFHNEVSVDIFYICEKIRFFIDQIFAFEFQQNVMVETINQYLKIQGEIADLQLILTNKLEKSQEFNEIFQQFNQQSENFKQNYIRFQYFLDIDKTSNQLAQMKEKEIKLQKHIELLDYQMKKEIELSIQSKDEENKKLREIIESIQMEKLELINKYDSYQKKQKESQEQINKEIVEQKIVLEKQNKEKEENIRKLNETIESIGKQNTYLSIKLNNPVYLQLCQIVVIHQNFYFYSHLNTRNNQLFLKSTSIQIVRSHKMENKLKMVHIVFVIKQFQKLESHHLHSKSFHQLLNAILELGLRRLLKRIIIMKTSVLDMGIEMLNSRSYTINSCKYCFSHHDTARDAKVLSFEFSINDIILIEVDIQNKIIKWTKANTNQSLTLNIDTTYDLYPCLWVQQSSGYGNKNENILVQNCYIKFLQYKLDQLLMIWFNYYSYQCYSDQDLKELCRLIQYDPVGHMQIYNEENIIKYMFDKSKYKAKFIRLHLSQLLELFTAVLKKIMEMEFKKIEYLYLDENRIWLEFESNSPKLSILQVKIQYFLSLQDINDFQILQDFKSENYLQQK
ncbi:unnamed protein product [Paramecium octaurelia]|uniref:Uncharacterized protein n=1 Tax=Paramecium octaurelia TaxID=43137 RepID=A0A8S1TYZ8_PAROT|nr:unnamed protein product [Paramecium octaurelia]